MFSSRSVLSAAILLCAALGSSCLGVDLVNGSTSNVLFCASSVGVGRVPVGLSLTWQASDGDTVAYGVGVTTNGSFTFQNGHDYQILLSDSGPVVVDRSPGQTAWFWWGFAFAFCAGMVGYSGRWAAGIISGGYNE